MVSALAMVALAFGQEAAPSEQPLQCALVTPGGDAVNFYIPAWDEVEHYVTLVGGGSDTVWPQRTLPGARGVMTDSPTADRVIAFGSADGLALEVAPATNGRQRPATLYRRDRRRLGLPVAFGFCALPVERVVTIYRMIDANADPREIGANIPAFDPAQWPEGDCGMILGDKRRTRFGFRLDGNMVRLSSPDLWSGRPVTLSIRWGTRNGLQFGSFNRRGGPSGTQVMHVDEDRGNAVKLIQLSDLDLGASARNQSGFAICGYRGLVRRPAVEG